MRIIADHIRASVFILAEGKVVPSNTDRGYVLRRLIRRAVRYGKDVGFYDNFTGRIGEVVIEIYSKLGYKELKENEKHIVLELTKEEEKI
jgi:alanyl-tRNA synthetase